MQADPGDIRLVNYILEHGYRWLIRSPAHLSFWDPPMFYPARNTAAYSEVMLGSAPIYWFWRAVQFLPDTAFQLWMLTVSTLNFLSADFFLRNCCRFSGVASAAGGFLFSFASPRLAQTSHPQLWPHFYTVGAIYALVRVFEANNPKSQRARGWMALFFLSVVAQFYAGFYLGWFLLVGLGAALLWALILSDLRKQLLAVFKNNQGMILILILVSALALAPMTLHYVEAGREVGFRSYTVVTLLVPTLHSWFYLGGGSWLYWWQKQMELFKVIPYGNEQQIGIGLLTLIVTTVGLYQERHRRLARLLLLSAITVFLCVTQLYPGVTLWKLLYYVVPGANAIRALSRVGLLMLVPASVGLAQFLDRNNSRKVTVLVLAAVVLEQGQSAASFDKHESRAEIRSLAEKIDRNCHYFYFAPWIKPGDTTAQWKLQLDALWAQMATSIPTVNRYSGNSPPGWSALYDNRINDGEDEQRLTQALGNWQRLHRLDPRRGRVFMLRPARDRGLSVQPTESRGSRKRAD